MPVIIPYQIQMIQSTTDDINCKHEVLVNEISIYNTQLKCPARKTGTQYIYVQGNYPNTPNAEVRNFRFYTNSL